MRRVFQFLLIALTSISAGDPFAAVPAFLVIRSHDKDRRRKIARCRNVAE